MCANRTCPLLRWQGAPRPKKTPPPPRKTRGARFRHRATDLWVRHPPRAAGNGGRHLSVNTHSPLVTVGATFRLMMEQKYIRTRSLTCPVPWLSPCWRWRVWHYCSILPRQEGMRKMSPLALTKGPRPRSFSRHVQTACMWLRQQLWPWLHFSVFFLGRAALPWSSSGHCPCVWHALE